MLSQPNIATLHSMLTIWAKYNPGLIIRNMFLSLRIMWISGGLDFSVIVDKDLRNLRNLCTNTALSIVIYADSLCCDATQCRDNVIDDSPTLSRITRQTIHIDEKAASTTNCHYHLVTCSSLLLFYYPSRHYQHRNILLNYIKTERELWKENLSEEIIHHFITSFLPAL